MIPSILLEVTLYQLNRSTQNGFDDQRKQKSPRMQLTDIQYTPTNEKGKQGLIVKSHCISGDSGNHYDQVIQFNKVVYEDEDTPQNTTVPTAGGQTAHINTESLANSDVKVRCTCLDFYWRFANFDFKQKALMGDPNPPYVRKTNRPPVNPLQKAGICKHIYALLQKVVPSAFNH